MIKLKHNTDENDFSQSALDLTPLLDILFILLVFFMLTSGLTALFFDLNLPSSEKNLSAGDSHKQITIAIHPNHYQLDSKRFTDFATFIKNLAQGG